MKKVIVISVLGILCAIIVLWLTRWGPTVDVRLTEYYSPVWSPDGKSVAFIRRSIKYAQVNPYLTVPVLTPGDDYHFINDDFELVIKSVEGSSERVIKKMPTNPEKGADSRFGEVEEAKLAWFKDGLIQYSILTSGFKENLDTGNNLIRSDGSGDTYLAPTYDVETEIVAAQPAFMNHRELYASNLTRSIVIFDHDKKTVKLFVGDREKALPKYRPAIEQAIR